MKCPNCGAEMPEGSLYCEQCGEDIHIVPDFEPEVEFNIEQTISGIAEDIKDNPGEPEAAEELSKQRFTRGKMIAAGVILGVLGLLLIIGGIWTYQYHSLSFQLEQAKTSIEREKYDKAIGYYKRALELCDSEYDISIKFDLAEAYFLKNNKIEYEYLLREIVNDEKATEEEIESAYGKLIAIYRARKDFKSINELLLASENEDVLMTYKDYVATAPEFSVPEGYYTDVQPLKLSAYGTGKIYYTLDGREPDEDSTQYTAPIILDDGEYVIKAYFVNEFGITSECITKTYHIEIEALPIPELSAVSGDYEFPINIEILGEEDNVYYTTDGSEPSISSTPYAGPIPMPLGKSTFKFVRMEGGRSSEVVKRTYNLTMNTEYTPEEAVADVVDYLMETGKIKDKAGHFDYSTARYQYEYRYVTNIGMDDVFYVVSEVFRDEEGIGARTGNHFAVNAYSGEIFKLQIDEGNKYFLTPTGGQSEE